MSERASDIRGTVDRRSLTEFSKSFLLRIIYGLSGDTRLFYYLKKFRSAYFFIYGRAFMLLYSYPKKVECNVCEWQGKAFMSDSWNKSHLCPRCGSHFRHRLLLLALQRIDELKFEKLVDGKRVLHFAPEPFMIAPLRSRAALYRTADYFDKKTDFNHVDMSDMKYIADNYFDVVIACDVLEHVPDDIKALQELKRVLTPGGCAILTVPQSDTNIKTLRDDSITAPLERQKVFGYHSHLRFYGHDFKELLEQSGFQVREISANSFSQREAKMHVLVPQVLSSHIFNNNFRKAFFAFKPGEDP